MEKKGDRRRGKDKGVAPFRIKRNYQKNKQPLKLNFYETGSKEYW